MKSKKFLALVGILLVVGVAITYLLQDSYYSKQSRAELLWRTLFYSTENQIASVRSAITKEPVFILDVPYFRQTYPVTCEVASLRMVLNYYGFSMSEDELITHLRFDTTRPITPDGIWGDPEEGFVGSVKGSIFHGTGYGVHDGPIKDLAEIYHNTVDLHEPDLTKIIGLVSSGKPVIVWGLLSSRDTISWRTEEEKRIEVYPGEHARVVIGYTGEAHDPKALILLDPIYGKIRMSTEKFVSDWEMMNKRTVVLQ